MKTAKRIRPTAYGADSKHIHGIGTATAIVPSATGKETYDPHNDPRTASSFFRDSYAVLVRAKSVRRHLYFNLPAAQRAIERAEKRGDRAEMVLVKLVPVTARNLDWEEGTDETD